MSPTHTDIFLTRVGDAFLALPVAMPYVGLVGALMTIAMNTYHEGEVSALTRMTDLCVSSLGHLLLSSEPPSAYAAPRAPGPAVDSWRPSARARCGSASGVGARLAVRGQLRLGHAHCYMCHI